MQPATSTIVRASSLGEVAWVGTDGLPRCAPVMVANRGDTPVLALTYARHELAMELGVSAEVMFSVTEPRGAGSQFTPHAWRGMPQLQTDAEGDIFLDELRVEELRRYPPARLMADSPLLCREHWWFLPRLLVELPEHEEVALAARAAPADHLLITGRGAQPVVTVVRLSEDVLQQPAVSDMPIAIVGGEQPVEGPAVIAGQDASFPELERHTSWQWRGHFDLSAGEGGDAEAGHLRVAEAPGRTGLAPTPGVWRRWQEQRSFERACRRGLKRLHQGSQDDDLNQRSE